MLMLPTCLLIMMRQLLGGAVRLRLRGEFWGHDLLGDAARYDTAAVLCAAQLSGWQNGCLGGQRIMWRLFRGGMQRSSRSSCRCS
jgi:hypothetical protein